MAGAANIQAVIFDVGGVLDQPADPLAEEADRLALAAELGMGLDDLWHHLYQTEPWMLARVGRITDAEFWQQSLARLGIYQEANIRAFVRRHYAFKEVAPAMRALLDDLRPRVRLAIISNATDTLESGLEGWGLTPYFEVIINSYRVGCAKPDPRIYCLALDRLQVRPDQAVFTDDQQHNVDAAAELGIRAIRFTGVPDLTAFLEDLGLTGD